MSRIRSIHPGIASDEAYMSMSMAAKAAWPILWTECDDHGVFEWKPLVLKARIFPADAVDFGAILDEYYQLGCIEMVEVEGKRFGYIRNFCLYQRPKKPKYRYPISESMLKYAGVKSQPSSTGSEPVPYQSPTGTENPPQMKEEGGSSTVTTSEDKPTIRRKAPRRISYPPRYQAFWDGYPTDPLMSKSEGFTEWQKLSSEDQEAAIAALPAFKAATAKLGPDHRVIHACRYLKKRRFDGFAAQAEQMAKTAEIASSRVYVKGGTDPGDAWDAHYRRQGKVPPRDRHGGWWFDTEYPPGYVQRETTAA